MQTENHTELAYLLKANGNTKCYITLYAEFCFHHIGQFLQRCKNLSDIMETWYLYHFQKRCFVKAIRYENRAELSVTCRTVSSSIIVGS